MNKVEATKLAKRVGMTKIYGTFHGCIIGYVPGFKGFSICNNTREDVLLVDLSVLDMQ